MAEHRPINFSREQPPIHDPDIDPGFGDSRPRPRYGLLVTLLVAVLAFTAWLFWGDEEEQVAVGEPEIIHADAGPVKVRPEDPGGMEVADRDKLVYRRLTGEEGPRDIERLLPPAEQPLPPPQAQIEEEPTTDMAEAPSEQIEQPGQLEEPTQSAEVASNDADATANPPADASSVLRAAAPISKPTPPSAQPASTGSTPTQPVRESDPSEVTTAAAPPSQQPERAGVYQIQLGAVRSQDRAQSAWDGYKNKHNDLLGELGSQVVRADLGAKGVFYRLRAGPILGQDKARSLCTKLSNRGVNCMVVRPGG